MNEIQIGMRVRVKREQPGRIGKPKCPGRVGVVTALNNRSRPAEDSGLWYVDLEATTRAKVRSDTLWGRELEAIE